MVIKKLISFTKRFEDPKYPVLGPNLKGLYVFGLWQTGSRTRNIIYNTIHFSSIFFIVSQIIELYITRNDLNKVLNNFSLTSPSTTCLCKVFSMVIYQSVWKELVNGISREEITQIKKRDQKTLMIIEKYTKYARFVTYSYCTLIFMTISLLVTSPLLRYLSSSSFRNGINSGVEPYPQILSSWFPFDNTKMPGYAFATVIQALISIQGAAVIGLFDTNAVTIMTFLKGQLILLKSKCSELFDSENSDAQDYMAKLIECHRHHNFLIEKYKLFNSLLSPVMFVYVLVCSMTICSSLIQITSGQISVYQKLFVIQFTIGQFFQLLIYCWHANEVLVESDNVDRGIFASDWWKADVRMKRHILMLAGKLNQPLVLKAGPFSSLSVPTFVSIIQGSYSFYTLISQMHDTK